MKADRIFLRVIPSNTDDANDSAFDSQEYERAIRSADARGDIMESQAIRAVLLLHLSVNGRGDTLVDLGSAIRPSVPYRTKTSLTLSRR